MAPNLSATARTEIDCTPLNFAVCPLLEAAVNQRPLQSIKELKKAIESKWTQVLTRDFIIKSCPAAWQRLFGIREANANYIEF